MNKLIYMDGFDRVESEDGVVVFETQDLYCNEEEEDRIVIDNVVNMFNDEKTLEEIDLYLLDEARCTQDDREVIVEGIYAWLHPEEIN